MSRSTAPAGRTSIRMDVIRGLAAFLVVLGHAREKTMYMQDVRFPSAMYVLLAPTAYAQEAVSIFFVLSGYLVGGSVLRDARAHRFSWFAYFCKRISRLWVVLLPGLLLTFVIDSITRTVQAERFIIALEGSDNGWKTALCNALFLSPGWCRPYGTNASLWSLAYEFWFYMVFAAVASGAISSTRRLLRWTLALILLSAGFVALGPTLLGYSISWLMGVGVYELSRRRGCFAVPKLGYIVILVLLLGTMTATSFWQVDRGLQMVAVGLLASVLMILVVGQPDEFIRPNRCLRAVAWLGPWSYSLYVYHLPILTAIIAVTPNRLVSASPGFAVAVIYMSAVLAAGISWLLSLITERHTSRVRSMLLDLPVRVRRNRQRTKMSGSC